MSCSSLLTIRSNLRELFSHCERVLASAQAPDHVAFSEDELRMVCYYANQLAKPNSLMRRGSKATENR